MLSSLVEQEQEKRLRVIHQGGKLFVPAWDGIMGGGVLACSGRINERKGGGFYLIIMEC